MTVLMPADIDWPAYRLPGDRSPDPGRIGGPAARWHALLATGRQQGRALVWAAGLPVGITDPAVLVSRLDGVLGASAHLGRLERITANPDGSYEVYVQAGAGTRRGRAAAAYQVFELGLIAGALGTLAGSPLDGISSRPAGPDRCVYRLALPPGAPRPAPVPLAMRFPWLATVADPFLPLAPGLSADY